MNCKPGDLAIAVRRVKPEEIGTVVTCQELAPNNLLDSLKVLPDQKPVWRVNKEFTWSTRSQHFITKLFLVPDECLMPISPPDDFSEADIYTQRSLNKPVLV